MPGNKRETFACKMEDKKTKSFSPSVASGGSLITRGKERGTGTIANPLERPKASFPSSETIKFKLLLSTRGKGWEGSRPTALKTGCKDSAKNWVIHWLCCSVQWLRRKKWMRSFSSSGIKMLFNVWYWSSTMAFAATKRWSITSLGGCASGVVNAPWSRDSSYKRANLTSTNSSILLLEIHRYFKRSKSGMSFFLACASTRWLNSSRLISLLI